MSELTRSERLALLKCEIAEGLAEDAQDDRESGMSNPWDIGTGLRGQFYMSDPVRVKYRGAMMNATQGNADPMTSEPKPAESQLGTPDWTIAPDKATHWDSGLRRFCNQYGFFDITGDFGRRAPVSWGTDRYVERPTGWDGTGLPPVGTVCECLFNDGWVKVVVLSVNGDEAWVRRPRGSHIVSKGLGNEFRPIRTKEQQERESAITKARNACPYPGSESTKIDVEALYDAGMLKLPKATA